MRAKSKPQPRFSKGDKVMVSALKREAEITDIFWNGFTWMYSFKGEALSCGEMYLSEVK